MVFQALEVNPTEAEDLRDLDRGALSVSLVLLGKISLENGSIKVDGVGLPELLKGLVVEDEKLVSRRIRKRLISAISRFNANVFLHKYGGKHLWELVPGEMRGRYIESTNIHNIEMIMEDAKLRSLFKNYMHEVTMRYLRDGDVNRKVLLIKKCCPKILGITDRNLYDTPTFTAAEHKNFYVQLWRPTRKGFEYIVYRKKEKIGFLFEGDTLEKALVQATLHYDELLDFYNVLKKANVTSEQYFGLFTLPLYKEDKQPVRLTDMKEERKSEEMVYN